MKRMMKDRFGMVGIAVIGVGLLAGCTSMPSYEGPCPGEVRYVSTEKVSLKSAPEGLSSQVKELPYKAEVSVKEVVKVSPHFAGDKKMFPEFLIPCWVKVATADSEGYLPANVLVSEWLIANQNPNERVSDEGMVVAKRGFSEGEDMEMASMRGAVGKGTFLKSANYDAVGKLYVEQCEHLVSDDDLAAFVEEGALAANPVEPSRVLVEGKGSLAKFGEVSRRTFASALGQIADASDKDDDDASKLVSATGKAGAGLVYSELGPVQEFQVGESVAAKVLPAYKLLPMGDPRAAYVRKLAHAIAGASNDPMPYRGLMVALCDSKEVNAFAIPGGYLIITTGMLEFLEDEDELAAIIGHEIGHLELKHGMKAVGTEKVLKLFSLLKEVGMSGVKGDNLLVDQVTVMIDDVFGKMYDSVRNGYGVETESQADWRSLQLCNRLGYDTKALYDVLERFKATKGTYGGASYPAERGADILKYRSQFGYDEHSVSGREARARRYRMIVRK